MNEFKIKGYCGVCDCRVVLAGHASRCRPKSVSEGWTVDRKAAWIGDTVHRLDAQLALQYMNVPPEQWEPKVQTYTSNAAQAAYIRQLDPSLTSSSKHSAGTKFEALYTGDFRRQYLRDNFPVAGEMVVTAWDPPDLLRLTLFPYAPIG